VNTIFGGKEMYDNEFIEALMSGDDTLDASNAFIKQAEANGIDISALSDDEVMDIFTKLRKL
jgi:hypothetical protein